MELELSIKQNIALSPQVVQKLEILQMGSAQLLEYIENLAAENPMVELEQDYSRLDEYQQLQAKLNWLREADVQNKVYYQSDLDGSYDPLLNYSDHGDITLTGYLLEQLGEMPLSKAEREAAEYIAQCIDDNGFLPESLESLAGDSEQTDIIKGIEIIRSLEPAGVGAVDLRECLMLQLSRMDGAELARKIADSHLDSLVRNNYSRIAKSLKARKADVIDACALIRTLNPRPSSGFASAQPPIYIVPDLTVVKFSDHFELITNDYYFPGIKINSYYMQLLNDQSSNDEVKKYLTDKFRQAEWVVKCIEQRKSTVIKCAERIVERQQAFFAGGFLVPMTLALIAADLEVHPSTVSRAIRDKYLQCSAGIFPLSHFFSRSVGGDAGPDTAKALLLEAIENEDKQKPLSDSSLAEILQKKGVSISRRTVAKYRGELNIPVASLRCDNIK